MGLKRMRTLRAQGVASRVARSASFLVPESNIYTQTLNFESGCHKVLGKFYRIS